MYLNQVTPFQIMYNPPNVKKTDTNGSIIKKYLTRFGIEVIDKIIANKKNITDNESI